MLFSLCRGLDFRPAYRKVGDLVSFIKCPTLCLSATLTDDIVRDVSRMMALREPAVIAVKPDRYLCNLESVEYLLLIHSVNIDEVSMNY